MNNNIKQKLKRFLKKFHLYNLAMKVTGRSGRVKKILNDEIKYSFNAGTDNIESFLARIRLTIHTIEKMTVKGKGSEKFYIIQLNNLVELVDELNSKYRDYPSDGDAIVEILGAFDLAIATTGAEVLEKKKNEFIDKYNLQDVHARAIDIRVDKGLNLPFDYNSYSEFVKCRHSIREFKNEIVDKNVVEDIVSIAKICPSECNRQTCKVYYTADQERLREVYPDPIVSKDIYNVLLVTVDKSSYSQSEVLQPWIDGGIFAESMIMAIHAKGLGACLFQCIKETKRYAKVKQMANIPDNEDIVCFIGFGYLKDEVKYIGTHRKDTKDILKEYTITG